MKKRTPLPPVRSTQLFHAPVDPRAALCDFCDDPNPIWSYSARPFPHLSTAPTGHRLVQHMAGPWHACDECSTLIEADDRAGLLRRQASTIRVDELMDELQGRCPITPDQQPARRQRFVEDVQRIYEEFSANRTGSRILTGRE